MSGANDDALLEDEDGEDDYDLGNEEEEALLAEDCDDEQELQHESLNYLKKSSGRKNQYMNEKKLYRDSEEPLEDDVLELDDFETDILENTDCIERETYGEEQDELKDDGELQKDEMSYQDNMMHKSLMECEMGNVNNDTSEDLGHMQDTSGLEGNEHLQVSVENDETEHDRKESDDEEDDDEKEDGEGRGRFKSERTTIISLKGNKSFGNIPDTLDGLIPVDDKQEGAGRWKRSGARGSGFQRGSFRGNQRGFGGGPNFGGRRKQLGQNRPGGHQNMGFSHDRNEGLADQMSSLFGPPPSQFMQSHKIHFNPHFRGNIITQSEGPSWNDNALGNPPPSNSAPPSSHGGFHDLPRFPPPSMGGGYGGGGEHGDMLPGMMDQHRPQRQRSPPPLPLYPGSRLGGYDSSPGHPDYMRDDPYDNRGPPIQDSWMNPPQRIQESSLGPPIGHHHQYGGNGGGGGGGGHQHFQSGMPNERGVGEVLQHFRPTMQPGPLFSHVTSVAPPSLPQQGMMMQHQQQQPQHHLQSLMRNAPPLHNSGIGPGMMQIPPQEQRIPPPGFSPNEGRSIPSVHHGMSPWQDQPVNRSQMGGQHIPSMQPQQHSGYHHGDVPRQFPGDRGGGLQGQGGMHHAPHGSGASMSAPPPPFHSGGPLPQGVPPHSMHQQHHHHQGSPMRQHSFNSSSSNMGGNAGPSGSHNNGRFPGQGNSGNFQSPGFNRSPQSHAGPRPNRGSIHMGQGRGGMAPRRGVGTPNVRPLPAPKPVGEESFPTKRPPMESTTPTTLKPSPPKKRKVRKIVKNNLLEVETVDTLPDTTTTGEKEVKKEKSDNPEDAALMEYKKKIEEQKRLREKILQQKERRRKQTALLKQKELQEKAVLAAGDIPKGNAIATIVNRNPVEPSPSAPPVVIKKEPVMNNQPFVPPGNQSQPPPDVKMTQAQMAAARTKALMALKMAQNQTSAQHMGRGMALRGGLTSSPRGMMNQQLRPQNLVAVGNPPAGNAGQQMGQRAKFVQIKNEQGQMIRNKVPNVRPMMGGRGGIAFRGNMAGRGMVAGRGNAAVRGNAAGRGNMAGRGQTMEGMPLQGRPMGQGRANVMVTKGQQVQSPGGPLRLVQMLPAQQGHPQNQEPKMQPSMLLQRVVKNNVPGQIQQQPQGRKVVVQNMGGGGDCITAEGGMGSGAVIVENLADSTSEAELRKRCQDIGVVKSIKMVPGRHSALVEFQHPASAAAFCQRYERKIVDLSMITVRLANS